MRGPGGVRRMWWVCWDMDLAGGVEAVAEAQRTGKREPKTKLALVAGTGPLRCHGPS